MTSPLRSTLLSALSSLPSDLVHAGVTGHCDAFALALTERLALLGETASPVVITRERRSFTGDVVDTNPMSHVLVEALGTLWDVQGEDAFDNWELAWIQPDEDEEAEDSFDYTTLTPAALIALRQERDQRDPDAAMVKRYKAWLDEVLPAPSSPVVAVSRRPHRPA